MIKDKVNKHNSDNLNNKKTMKIADGVPKIVNLPLNMQNQSKNTSNNNHSNHNNNNKLPSFHIYNNQKNYKNHNTDNNHNSSKNPVDIRSFPSTSTFVTDLRKNTVNSDENFLLQKKKKVTAFSTTPKTRKLPKVPKIAQKRGRKLKIIQQITLSQEEINSLQEDLTQKKKRKKN